MADKSRKLVLAARPTGIPGPEHFRLEEEVLPPLAADRMRLRTIYLSIDPAMRGWVHAAANYAEPVALGAVMRSLGIGEVMESRIDGFVPGDLIYGFVGWQEVADIGADTVWFKVDPALAPLSAFAGILGINGLTAYFGLLEAGQPRSGDTVVVSTGAGAVGSAVGQIAKIKGCRTVAITGSDDKVADCLDLYGYDRAINYKTCMDLDAALEEACPDGIHVYFDNVAGAISDAVLAQLANDARVVICGTASIENWDPIPLGPRVERRLMVKAARMQGFLVVQWLHRHAEAIEALAQWLNQGKLTYREEIEDGLAAAPTALRGLFDGTNRGKKLIRIRAEP